jgi:hypothetical protein
LRAKRSNLLIVQRAIRNKEQQSVLANIFNSNPLLLSPLTNKPLYKEQIASPSCARLAMKTFIVMHCCRSLQQGDPSAGSG